MAVNVLRVLASLVVVFSTFGLVVIYGPDIAHGSRLVYVVRPEVEWGEFERDLAFVAITSNLRGTRTYGDPRVSLDYQVPREPLDRTLFDPEAPRETAVGVFRALLDEKWPDIEEVRRQAWAVDLDRLCRMMVNDPQRAWVLAREGSEQELAYSTSFPEGWSFRFRGPGEAPYRMAPTGVYNLLWLVGGSVVGIWGVNRGFTVFQRRQSRAGEAHLDGARDSS